MKESEFQGKLRNKLKKMFPGCMVTKLDTSNFQGIPDLLILYGSQWATLEVKKSKNAHHQPNQDHCVERTNAMSFSRFIYPENEKAVLQELERKFNE